MWYVQSHNANNLMRAANEIKQAFPTYVPNNFVVTDLFIVTWADIGYYNQQTDKVFVNNSSVLIIDLNLKSGSVWCFTDALIIITNKC